MLGILLDDWFDAHLYRLTVATTLILYGVIFILIERRPRPPRTAKPGITYRQAGIVGLWQVLSLVPGTSRSGATIIGGTCGMSRPCASQFTFFLAIPVMLGASGLKLVKFFRGRQPTGPRGRGRGAAGGLRGGLPGLDAGHPLPDGLCQTAHLHGLRLVPSRWALWCWRVRSGNACSRPPPRRLTIKQQTREDPGAFRRDLSLYSGVSEDIRGTAVSGRRGGLPDQPSWCWGCRRGCVRSDAPLLCGDRQYSPRLLRGGRGLWV